MLPLPVASIASTVVYAFQTSDWFGKSVVIILLAGSVFAWSIMITKAREFARARRAARRFVVAYRREGHPLALYSQGREYSGPLYALYRETCTAVLSDAGSRAVNPDLFAGPGARARLGPLEISTARKVVERTAMDLAAFLEEDMGMLATSVTAAPFLGLLGTVWGVMDAFKAMAASGAVLLAEVAPGISGALLTTVVGLVVALPSLIGYNLLTNEMRRICNQMDNFAEEFIHDLERHFLQPE
jgi:biopolymer transport protein TolQ